MQQRYVKHSNNNSTLPSSDDQNQDSHLSFKSQVPKPKNIQLSPHLELFFNNKSWMLFVSIVIVYASLEYIQESLQLVSEAALTYTSKKFIHCKLICHFYKLYKHNYLFFKKSTFSCYKFLIQNDLLTAYKPNFISYNHIRQKYSAVLISNTQDSSRYIMVKLNGVIHRTRFTGMAVSASIAHFLILKPSCFFLTINGIPFKDGDPINLTSIFTVNFRLNGGTKPNSESYTQPFRPQLIFLDSDGTPSSWFRILEARTTSRLASRTDLLLDSIPNELMAELGSEIADALDSKVPYDNIKATILKKYQPSSTANFDKLTNLTQYNGSKPSIFLKNLIRDLDNIHPGLSSNHPYLTHIFLKVLPSHIRTALLVVDSEDPFHLARIADRLTTNIPETKRLFNHLDRQLPSINSTLHTSNTTPHTLVCFYHKTFQNLAKSCCIGCTWPDPPAQLRIIPTCIYHNIFGRKANKCLSGCTSHYRVEHISSLPAQKN